MRHTHKETHINLKRDLNYLRRYAKKSPKSPIKEPCFALRRDLLTLWLRSGKAADLLSDAILCYQHLNKGGGGASGEVG